MCPQHLTSRTDLERGNGETDGAVMAGETKLKTYCGALVKVAPFSIFSAVNIQSHRLTNLFYPKQYLREHFLLSHERNIYNRTSRLFLENTVYDRSGRDVFS